MPILTRAPPGALRSLLPPGGAPAEAWTTLQETLGRRLSPAHAALFAEPVAADGGLGWAVEGASAARFYDLAAARREAISGELGRLVSDIRRLRQAIEATPRDRDAAAAPLLGTAQEIPGFDYVFLAEGRPVLAAWGHVPAGAAGPLGLLARLDDGAPWRPPPRQPWRVWAATAAALLLLLFLAPALLAALPWNWLAAPLPVCTVDDARLGALEALDGERDRGRSLQTELARLREEIGRRRAQCPLPPAQVAEAPRPPPPPPPAPPPRPRPPEPPAAAPPPAPAPAPPPPAPPQLDEDQARVQQRGGRTGRLQVILAWDDLNDLDLKVVCPTGETVWADNRVACNGGRLDVDANCCQGQWFQDRPVRNPVENIVWQNPPNGRYRVIVDFYSRRQPPTSSYRVTVLVDGQPRWHGEGVLRQSERNRAVLDFAIPPP